MTVKSVTAVEGARKAARLRAGLSGRPWPPDLLRAADAPRFLHSRRRGASADLRRKSRIDRGFAGKKRSRRRREAALPPQLANTRLDAHFDCSTLRHSFVEWRSVRRPRETARRRGGSAA